MPYINEEFRESLDKSIDKLSTLISSLSEDEREGVLNYTLTCIAVKSIKGKDKWRYRYFNRLMGVLSCMTHEIYRRMVIPYEEKCVEKNGDLNCFIGD